MTARIVVVGDVLLDVDIQTDTQRLVPDTAAPVLDVTARTERPGGAGLAALLAARDGDVEVTLLAPLGGPAGARVLELLAPSVQVHELPGTGATITKTRVLRGRQTVARLDEGGVDGEVSEVPAEAAQALARADAVLVADYGRGVTAAPAVRAALAATARRRPVVWDPHPRGAAPVPGTRVATPNTAEAAAATGLPRADDLPAASRQARRLAEQWPVAAVALTLGAGGAVLSSGDDVFVAPVLTRADGDTCGAGDRFAARLTTALAAGAVPSEAVTAAVAAASAFVAAGGAAGVDDAPAAGTVDPRDTVAAVRAAGGTVVATGGCFDLLHAGHVATLEAARALGDCLVVCLNSDRSVRRSKGPDRPWQSAADRARVLRGLRAVDEVIVFDEDTPEAVIARLRPDVWVKGGDYNADALPEAALVRSWGGEVITVPYLDGRSTSRLAGLLRTGAG
jgi:D-beta-D-heptose 7-phosphate kinase / D-beta-D-heptose 1-phosphate adenosyltransferase